jgi:hypothetical protein
VLVPLPEHVERVPQNLVVLELRLCPIGSALLDLKGLATFQVIAQAVYHLAEDPVRFAGVYFIRPNLIDEIVDDIAHVHGVQHAEAEINGELQPRFTRCGLDSVTVFEQENAETVEARILQGESIFRFVHAESARTAGTSGEKDVVIENLLARQAFFLQKLEILHQIAYGEVGRIALAVIAELLTGLKCGHVGHRQLLAAVAATLEDRANQVLVLPGKASKQNRDAVPLFRGERPLHWTMEMCGLIKACDLTQAHAFGFETLLNFRVILNADEIRRHKVLRRWAEL